MAKRFYSEFNDLRNQHFTIEIWDADFSGTATTFNPGEEGFLYDFEKQQERTHTMLPTHCTVRFRIETSEHNTFLTDIIASKEGRFTLKITKGTGSPTLFWVGLIIADVGQNEEAYKPFFTLTAVDGLGVLKDEKYKDGANFYTGKATHKQHLINALTKLSYVNTHFATTERFLRIAVDWWEETMTNNSTNDPLNLTYVDHAAWYTYERDVQDVVSCWDVIDNIMRCFGARITQHEGVFWVEQISYRTASTIVLRSYDKAGTYLSSNNFSTQNTIDQTASGALFSGGVYEFFAPLSEARHTYEVALRANLLAGVFVIQSTGPVTVYHPVHANSGQTTLRLTFNLAMLLTNDTFTGDLTVPRYAIFACTLKIGSKWLKRDYTFQNFQVNFGAFSWEGSSSVFYVAVPIPNGLPASGQLNGFTQFQDLMIPAIPEGGDSFIFDVDIYAITQVGTLTDFTITYSVLTPVLEFFSNGTPDLGADAYLFTSENPDVENTKVHETECIIGNSADPNAVGALWVKPSSTYILADDWGDGTDTPDRDIERLNVELVVGGQQQPIRRLSGTLYGTLSLMGRVVWQSTNWLLLGGTYNAALAQFAGEWFELDYDGAGLSTSGPIRLKKKVSLPDVPPIDGGGNFSGQPVYKLGSTPPGTLLYPVAATRTLDHLLAGSIMNVPVTDTLAAGDFYDGDKIVILNPITGNFDELEVVTTTSNGDTWIVVTGDLTGDYPPDSPIIKKPLIGHPTVFGAGLANRLAYWVSESELAEMAAGTDGWPLVSNGASLAAYEQLTTTGIADDAVTFAKMQNIATSKLLGRYSAGSGDVQEITISTGLSLDGSGNLTASAGGNYQTLRDDGANMTQRANANFVSGSEIAFTLTDDAGNNETEIAAAVVTNSITNSLFRQSAGLSVVGVTGNATANVADITAGTDGNVLRRSGTVLGFGPIDLSSSNAVTGVLQVGKGGTGLIALGSALQLLRVNAGATSLEYFTFSGLTGSLTSPRIPFASGASALTDDSNLQWDNTNKRLSVGSGTALGVVSATAGTISTATQFFYATANNSSNNIAFIGNTNNATTNANTIYQMSVGGASAGDPVIQLTVSGVASHAIGLDNSDSDKIKITPNASTPGATLNSGVIITADAVPLVGINKDAPAHPLDVTGRGRANLWCQIQSNPTVVMGSAAGTGATGSCTGGANSFQIVFTTGTGPTASGNLFSVTLPTAFPSVLHFTWSPRNAQAATDLNKMFASAFTSSQLTISANGALAASTQYILYFVGCGY